MQHNRKACKNETSQRSVPSPTSQWNVQIFNAIVANLVTDVYNLPKTNQFIFVVFSIFSIKFQSSAVEGKVSNQSSFSKINFLKCFTKKKDASFRIEDENIKVETQRMSETSKNEKAKGRIFIVGGLFLCFIVL